RIDRATAEGAHIDDWFASFGRADAYDISHLNVGLIPLQVGTVDNDAIRFAYGGVLVGFGIGGDVHFGTALADLPNHIDLHLERASYFADDLAIMRDGELTGES